MRRSPQRAGTRGWRRGGAGGPLALSALTAATLFPGPAAEAALQVLRGDGEPAAPDEATVVFDPETGGWNITLEALYAPGRWTVYDIRGDGGETIDKLVIDVPCLRDSSGQCLRTGSPVIVRVSGDEGQGIDAVHRVVQTGTAETIVSRLEVRGDLGSVEVNEIGIVRAGGDVFGPVSADVAGAARGINTIDARGDILGDVTAERGRIILVLAQGRIGLDEHPVRIAAKHGIVQIGSYGGIRAQVDAGAGGGEGGMFAFGATSFVGSLKLAGLFSNPWSGLPGRITILDRFEGSIRIAGSFVDPEQWIDLPPAGLAGQILINAADLPGGAWSSPVYVGPEGDPDRVVLTGPGYPQTAEGLGGGAVGLVPFDLHEESCVPPGGSTVTGGGEPVVVRLRHYGPVEIAGPAPLVFARRPAGSDEPFQLVDAGGFQVTPDPADANAVRAAPAPGRGFEGGFDYRLTATGDLRCAAADRPPVAWTGTYRITVTAGGKCPGDVDGSGGVDVADLLAVLAAWGPCPGCPEDLDGDGAAGVADLLAVLAAWGPCP